MFESYPLELEPTRIEKEPPVDLNVYFKTPSFKGVMLYPEATWLLTEERCPMLEIPMSDVRLRADSADVRAFGGAVQILAPLSCRLESSRGRRILICEPSTPEREMEIFEEIEE